MKKWNWGLLLLLLLAVPAMGQEHAPTAAQCQADVAVWGDEKMQTEYLDAETAFIKNGTPNKTDVAKLPFGELQARIMEMGDCMKVDPQRLEKYHDALAFYHSVGGDRLFRFITRHILWPQFNLEDAQGKR